MFCFFHFGNTRFPIGQCFLTVLAKKVVLFNGFSHKGSFLGMIKGHPTFLSFEWFTLDIHLGS